MQTYAEQLAAYEAKRAGNIARQKAIMDAAAEEGATLDEAAQEEFDTLDEENGVIDGHLKRLRTMIDREKATAKPVDGSNAENGSQTRGGDPIVIKRQPKLAPGQAFTRLLMAYGAAKGNVELAQRIAANRFGPDSDVVGELKAIYDRGEQALAWGGREKAPVLAGSTISGTWAADLVLDEGGSFADFADYLRAETILGKFGTGNIPSLNGIPFRTALGISTAGMQGYWVGEGLAKPLTSGNVNKTFLEPLKCANITVLTQELLTSSKRSAEEYVQRELRNALVELIDVSFIDPTNAGTANVEPAAITNGADAIAASAGGDADDIRLDLRSLIAKFVNAHQGGGIVLIMQTLDALAASMLTNALGQAEFPGITMEGGVLHGLPVITSQSVPSGIVVAVQPSEIYFADEGGFMLDASDQASLLMTTDANANHNSVTPTGSSVVSMWQTNSVAFRCERILNWSRRRETAVAYLTGVAWGGAVNT